MIRLSAPGFRLAHHGTPACRTPSETWEPNPRREVTAALPVPGPEPVPARAMGGRIREVQEAGIKNFRLADKSMACLEIGWISSTVLRRDYDNGQTLWVEAPSTGLPFAPASGILPRL